MFMTNALILDFLLYANPLLSGDVPRLLRSSSAKRSRISIKSDRWRVVIIFEQATECHLAFVREELRIV